MFVETVLLNEDAEYQARLVNTITEQTNLARDSVQEITPTSSAVQVTKAISGVVQSRDVLSESRYSETEPLVETVMKVCVISLVVHVRFSYAGRNCLESHMTLTTAYGPCLRGCRIKIKR